MAVPERKFVPPSTVRRQKVRLIRFTHPVFITTLGHMRELKADTKLTADRPGGFGRNTPIPEMWYHGEEQCLVVGTQRFHVANATVESWSTEDQPENPAE
jgi:hypothetical protein